MTCDGSEAMYDYAGLPTLVLNEIFGYLSVKQRIKCKAVCRSWKEEIELREQTNDTLVLHLGPYLWNMRWSETNQRGLMKFENSFEVKNLSILEHPLTGSLLEKIKKLAVVGTFSNAFNPEITNLYSYTGYFKQCEELEIRNFKLLETLTFDLPKLKVLVINDSPAERLALNCPSLEVLFWNRRASEIDLKNVQKLKRLTGFGWPVKISSDDKFERLEYLNLFVARGERVSDRLLEVMPKLKRLVLYSSNLQADLESVRKQQGLFGLKTLEILCSGFRDPVEIALNHDVTGFVRIEGERNVGKLFANYSKLVENSPWKAWIDYSQLFGKFRILPSNFFERFDAPYSIEISKVTSYTHLFAFLKCYPFVQRLTIHFSKVKADLILDLIYLLQHSLTELIIREEHASEVLQIDLSCMRRLSLAVVCLESARLPAEFLRRVAAKRSAHFRALTFEALADQHRFLIYLSPQGSFSLSDVTCEQSPPDFSSIEELISFMQHRPHFKEFLHV